MRAGRSTVTPNTVDPEDPTGDPLHGFTLKTDNTNPLRTAIQIHGPGITTGCIGFENNPDVFGSKGFSAFEPRIRGNNYPACFHSAIFKNPVPISLGYGMDTGHAPQTGTVLFDCFEI